MTTQATAPQKQRAWLPVLLIGLRLLLICAAVAGIISFVHAVTKPKAEANLREEKRKAIINIFATDTLTYEQDADDAAFYRVFDAEKSPIGYCVESTAGGFGGDLTLMVGYDAAGTIKGVSIISHSETPGLGARVNDVNYLSQYIGHSGEQKLDTTADVIVGGNNGQIDAISGATISSRAVLSAVNAATERLQTYLASGGDAQ